MDNTYTQKFTITKEHTDLNGRLKASALLYFVQEVSGAHAAILGTDWETLNEKNLFWAIIRHRIQITRLPGENQTITLKTWPMPTRAAYPRATVAYDEDGQELFRTTALWVLMDTEKRSMVMPAKSGVTVDGILTGTELPAPGALPPVELSHTCQRQVTEAELDRNRHTNNTRYMDWLEDLPDEDYRKEHPIREFTVCYLSESFAGQNIDLQWEMTAGNILTAQAVRKHSETDKNAERIFAAQIVY